jgi:alpha-tubulin suppressor-like RCC1 family protein
VLQSPPPRKACRSLALARCAYYCWGANNAGRLGPATTTDSCTDTLLWAPCSFTPLEVEGVINAVSVSGGGGHTCAVLNDGGVRCWGENWEGQLGDGTTPQSSTPVSVQGLVDATFVSAGVTHTCAIASGGRVYCWGNNGDGQLGNGTHDSSPMPAPIADLQW